MRSWAEMSGSLNDEDIFISGDVDEVISREALVKLRWCETSDSIITGALWMPTGNFDRALKTDFSVTGRPHTFGLPTIYLWSQVKEKESGLGGRLMTELNDRRDKNVLGGIHMTNHAFLPSNILKELTATEDNFYAGFINTAYLLEMNVQDMDEEQNNLYTMGDKQCWLAQCDRAEDVKDIDLYIPWFLSCNTERFPYWFGLPDPRNNELFGSMNQIRNSLAFVKQSYWEKSKVKKLFKYSIFHLL